MTPKEKAKEIYEKLYFVKVNTVGGWMFKESAKQCALICVDEILMSQHNVWENTIEYWQDVKQEINKI